MILRCLPRAKCGHSAFVFLRVMQTVLGESYNVLEVALRIFRIIRNLENFF